MNGTEQMEKSISPRLKAVVADVLGVEEEHVTFDAGPSQLQEWDSFRHLQLILAVESEFGVRVDPPRIAELVSVARLQQWLEGEGLL